MLDSIYRMVSQQSFVIGLIIILSNLAISLPSQGQDTVTLYYDQAQQIPKETFQVAGNDPTVLHGSYTAYFYDGSVKTKGTYHQNQPNGYWEYFYENGQLKMQGELKDGQNQGEWKYF
ncbi:MAG: hypothetical protein AAF223_20925, partial [Bacteroidota bacterium]